MPDSVASIRGRRLGLDADGRLVVLPNDDSGTPKLVGRLAYLNTAPSSTITNTAAETAFDTSYSIPPNSLKAGSLVKIKYQGIAPSTNATDTLTIRLRFGGLAGTVLLAGTATDVANNNIFAGEFEVAIRTAGASGTMVGYGTHTEVPAASGTAVHDITEVLPATTVDTTAAQVVNVTATWSVANAANQVRLDFMRVEIW